MDTTQTVRAYHERTKHRLDAYAKGPEFLDWDQQPNPFRRFAGAEVVELPLEEKGGGVLQHYCNSPSAYPRGNNTALTDGHCAATRPAATCTPPKATLSPTVSTA